MIIYLWNAFISGVLFFAYLIADSWWWIFGVIVFVLLAILEGKEVDEMFQDDEREVF